MQDPNDVQPRCLACGGALPSLLFLTGSMRCHDCREDKAPLKVELVQDESRRAA